MQLTDLGTVINSNYEEFVIKRAAKAYQQRAPVTIISWNSLARDSAAKPQEGTLSWIGYSIILAERSGLRMHWPPSPLLDMRQRTSAAWPERFK
ncbi:hypothetical protein DTO217A2_3681 [Paecilomyces variotii]|nr:hypothetical protein DTO217A2_3681 [Paecilomyces variotii]